MRIFDGGATYKISQEIQTLFDTTNPAAQQTIWARNNPGVKRFYIGLPTGSATAPSLILPLDYRELESPSAISGSGPIHISFTGKMISSDLARKWSKWNIKANCGEILARPGNGQKFFIGGGNGVAPGGSTSQAFGNVYYFDSAKLTDDDYGQIVPYYTTYFFVNHEQEQQLQVGSLRKLFEYLTCYVTGTGILQITPFGDSLSNSFPGIFKTFDFQNNAIAGIQLKSSLNSDLGENTNADAERMAFKISIVPLTGQTDVKFNLQKMVVQMKQHPFSPKRGSNV